MASAKAPVGRRGKKAKAAQKLGLTARERQFVEHFALHHNAAEAYADAYPASRKHNALYRTKKGSEMLAKPYIAEAVAEKAKVVTQIANEKFEINAQAVLQEIAALAFANSESYFDWGSYERPAFKKNGDPIIDTRTGKQRMDTVPYVRIKASNDLTRVQKAAIVAAEETVSKTGDRVISVKMGNKLQALKLLGDHLRIFAPPADGGIGGTFVNANVTVNNTNITTIDDKREALKAFQSMRATAMIVDASSSGK